MLEGVPETPALPSSTHQPHPPEPRPSSQPLPPIPTSDDIPEVDPTVGKCMDPSRVTCISRLMSDPRKST